MRRGVTSSCIAAMLSFGVVAFAQTTGQNPTGSSGQAGSQTMTQSPVGDRTQTQQQLTLVGCVQREAEFRQAAGSGGGGLGAANEFVLTSAKPSTEAGAQSASAADPASTPAATSSTPTAATGTPETPAATTGTSGTASATASAPSSTTTISSGGVAYSLTGSRESELDKHVGQRVEIVGTLEGTSADASASATTAAGTVSGSASQRVGDLKTVKIVSFRAIGGACTP